VTKPNRQGSNIPANRRARRAARLAAVQALYQMELTGDDSEAVKNQFIEHRFPRVEANEPDEKYFAEILSGVPRHQMEIDAAISNALSDEWPLKRIDSTLRAILRAAVFELIARPKIPVRAAIAEYVDIAHAFFHADEPQFVNAVLDRIAREKRAKEFGESLPDDAIDF